MVLKAAFDKAGITKPPCEVFDMIAGTSTGGYVVLGGEALLYQETNTFQLDRHHAGSA